MKQNNIPQHIALIPDGNRRWVRERGLDTLEGHLAGYKKFVPFCRWASARGVKAITIFGFSSENWNREAREVSYLMELIERAFKESFSSQATDREAEQLGVRVRVLGGRDQLPLSLQEAIADVETYTADRTAGKQRMPSCIFTPGTAGF